MTPNTQLATTPVPPALLAATFDTLARIPLDRGDVCLVAHGHLLRILTACWLGLPPRDGRLLVLAPAHLSVLGHEHDQRVVLSWNA